MTDKAGRDCLLTGTEDAAGGGGGDMYGCIAGWTARTADGGVTTACPC